jgi:hypothetical protein
MASDRRAASLAGQRCQRIVPRSFSERIGVGAVHHAGVQSDLGYRDASDGIPRGRRGEGGAGVVVEVWLVGGVVVGGVLWSSVENSCRSRLCCWEA